MALFVVAILVVALVSLAFNAGYILHELGWFPHTKERSKPADRKFPFRSRYEKNVLVTHDHQVAAPLTDVLRRFGHPDVYMFDDPYRALENVIRRYEERPTKARHDDVIHLPNFICNHVRCDDKVNALIGRIHKLIQARPPERS